jgi:hypothetical protein
LLKEFRFRDKTGKASRRKSLCAVSDYRQNTYVLAKAGEAFGLKVGYAHPKNSDSPQDLPSHLYCEVYFDNRKIAGRVVASKSTLNLESDRLVFPGVASCDDDLQDNQENRAPINAHQICSGVIEIIFWRGEF